MILKILKPVGQLKSGGQIALRKNAANYFVGPNGCGKTVLLGALAESLKDKTETPCWFAFPPDYMKDSFSFEGFESISKFYFFTGKTRQAQWLDMTYALGTPASVNALKLSEGRNAQIELIEAFKKFKDDPNSLVVFDEIDSNLDLKTKKLFWNHALPQFEGTTIVVSHDPLFPCRETVVDFSDLKEKSFEEYYDEQ